MTQKEDCEALMSSALPFATQMLEKEREFYPYGSTLSASGQIARVAGWTGEEHPPSTEIIALLEREFRAGASEREYKATALVYDVRVVPPGKAAKQDAIAVNLDHEGGYSVVVTFPYSFSSSGQLDVEDPFASPGAGKIFPK